MQIIHRLSIRSSPELGQELASLGVDVSTQERLISFEIDESSHAWPAVKQWAERRLPVDLVFSKFTEEEIRDARWLEIEPEWHHGYPQPEDDYLATTYDMTEYCNACGIGLKQKAPFRMKSEPKWGRRGILQLNWIFDEYFATPDIWASVFNQWEISSAPVLDKRGGQLRTVVQLTVEENIPLDTHKLIATVCPACHRPKYAPVARGPFPRLAREPKAALAKTAEYFGSGASAYRGVIISQKLARIIQEKKIRGVTFVPVSSS